MINDICEIDRITPLRGLRLRGDSFRRALPYANDLRAFSPMNCKNNNPKSVSQRVTFSFTPIHDEKLPFHELIMRIITISIFQTELITNSFTRLNMCGNHKAESLVVNSVGQRPTERITPQTKAPKGRNQPYYQSLNQ